MALACGYVRNLNPTNDDITATFCAQLKNQLSHNIPAIDHNLVPLKTS